MLQDYSISMYLRQAWIDPRLEYLKYDMTYGDLRMGKGSWNKIWIPDTFLRNEKGYSNFLFLFKLCLVVIKWPMFQTEV